MAEQLPVKQSDEGSSPSHGAFKYSRILIMLRTINNKDIDTSKFVGFSKEYGTPMIGSISRSKAIMDSIGLIPGENILFNPLKRIDNRLSNMGIDIPLDKQRQLGYWYVGDGVIYTYDPIFIHEMGHLFTVDGPQMSAFDFGLLCKYPTDDMIFNESRAKAIEFTLANQKEYEYNDFISEIFIVISAQRSSSMPKDVKDVFREISEQRSNFGYIEKRIPILNRCWEKCEEYTKFSYDDIIDNLKIKVSKLVNQE